MSRLPVQERVDHLSVASTVGYSDETISALMTLMEREFEKRRIMDEDLRRDVCRRLLSAGSIEALAETKYNIATMLATGMEVDDVVEEENVRTLRVHHVLSARQEVAITRNNRDYRLLFDPVDTMPHSYAAAQRSIDTQRCLKHCNGYDGAIGDIGGNYSMHTRAGNSIHSCTLVADVRNVHRNIERDINLEATYGVGVKADHCVDGVQSCDAQYTQAISVHTMPDIPVEDWPDIMDRHGTQHLVGVFHFDNVMYQLENGKLPDCDMIFQRDGEDVIFHFENDSSFEYRHNWENLRKYAQPWAMNSKLGTYTYLYNILHVGGGVMTVEINRVLTNTLGRQIERPLYAYVPNEEWVQVESCMRDVTSGCDAMSAAAYSRVTVQVPREFYEFMVMYALSASGVGGRLDKDAFSAMALTYNSTRSFNNVCVTGKHKLSTFNVDTLIDCVWHYVLWYRANNEQRIRVMNKALLAGQQLPGIPSLQAIALVPVTVAVAPLVMVGDLFAHYTKAFRSAWAALLTQRLSLPSVIDMPCYVRLQPVGVTVFGGYYPQSQLVERRQLPRTPQMSVEEIFEAYVSQPPSEEGSVFDESIVTETDSEDSGETADTVVSFVTADVVQEIVTCVKDDDLNCDVRESYAKRFQTYQKFYRARNNNKVNVVDGCTTEEVHEEANQMMLEYALYCLDTGEGTMSALRGLARSVAPGGHINTLRVENQNFGADAGIMFFDVSAGYTKAVMAEYSVCVDIKSLRVHKIRLSRSGDHAEVLHARSGIMMVDKTCKVFNSFQLAFSVLQLVDDAYKPTCNLKLVDGVPGCGKTTEIVNLFTMNDFFVSTAKDSRDDTFMRLVKKFQSEGDTKELEKRVRTNDSLIMHGAKLGVTQVQVLYADEGLMAFPGAIQAMIAIVRPREVRVYGDSMQIGAIDRSPSMGVLMYQRVMRWHSIEIRDVSLSMPADVCVLLSKLYGRVVYTKSPVRRSLRVAHVPDVAHPVYTQGQKGIDYMSVLTADRGKLVSARGFVDGKIAARALAAGKPDSRAKVYSVHEAQGQRFNRSVVVRMNPNTIAVLDSTAHIIVALSRHYYDCCYATLVNDDKLSRLMRTKVSDEELALVSKPTEQWMLDRIARIESEVVGN